MIFTNQLNFNDFKDIKKPLIIKILMKFFLTFKFFDFNYFYLVFFF